MTDDPVSPALALLAEGLPAGTGWALVGGLAVSARAEPRFTRDVDVVVAVADDGEAELLVSSLARAGWSAAAIVEQEEVGRLAQVRFWPPSSVAVVCDLLFASSGIEPEVVSAAEVLTVVPGLEIPVARVGHLLALKLLSVDDRRFQDRLDLEALAAVAEHEDWLLAEEAARLIVERGFGRGRDLVSATRELERRHDISNG